MQPFADYTADDLVDDGRDPEQPQRLQGRGTTKHRGSGRARRIKGSVGYGNRDQVKEHERQANGDRREPGAENADEFTKRRLLHLAASYDKQLAAAGPSAAIRTLKVPLNVHVPET